jgi:pimeloyl-ACP methyl ester carboxylesterase
VFFMPFALPMWLLGLFSLGLAVGGVYFVYAWAVGALVGALYLAGGAAMVLLSALGRPIVLRLLRRPGPDEPSLERAGPVRRVPGAAGTELAVETYGPAGAPTLVLTHGWGANGAAWYYARRGLGDRFRLVMWDLAGLGASRGPADADYSVERMARDLAAVLATTGDRPVVLVGHSIGGMINYAFCRLFPEQVGRKVVGLVQVDTSHTNPIGTVPLSPLMQALRWPLFEPLLRLTVWFSPLVRLMNWMSYLNGSAHLVTAFSGFAGSETRGQLDFSALLTPKASPAVLARGMLGMLRYDEAATLPTIPIPVLLVTGDTDRVVVPETSERMRALLPSAELSVLAPAGHMAVLERHAELNGAIAGFCERCFASGAAPLRETA